jgi:hypothetical protein
VDRLRLAGIAAAGALLLIAGVLAVIGGDGGPDGGSVAAPARFVDAEELTRLEADLGHPIYWLGERPSTTLEAASEADGSIYLRYLPRRVEAGDPRPFLTVGTYPVVDAARALARTARKSGAPVRRLQDGAVLLANPAARESAYFAYAGEDLQVEVYDPAGRARQLIEAGALEPVGG